MTQEMEAGIRRLFRITRKQIDSALVPDDLTVSQWADKYRRLSPESSAEAGPWRTKKTPYLKDVMDSFTDPKIRHIVMVAASQVGKALDIETPIPTPDGWKSMGDLKPGDVVFDETGHQCTVTWTTEIMHDRPCIEMVFSDGAVIVCDMEHRWAADKFTGGRNERKGVFTAGEMITDYKAGNRNRYAVQVCEPLQCDEKELPIPPYTLGYWLGDGNSASAQLTVAKADSEIISYINREGIETEIADKADTTYIVKMDQALPKFVDGRCRRGHLISEVGLTSNGYCAECHRQHAKHFLYGSKVDEKIPRRKSMHKRLLDLGVLNNKHIPAEYLRASEQQRLALLQGIMDSDGSISPRGRCEITLKSERLVQDVRELLASLGIKSTIRPRTATCPTSRGLYSCQVYRLSFLVYSDAPVFRLRRKLERMPNRSGRRTTETERRRVVSMTPVESRPVKCIAVDSPSHLYLAGKEMIPTHNSECMNNIVGYIIDQDPGSILMIEPTNGDAKEYSKLRIAPMIRDSKTLRKKVSKNLRGDTGNTILQKSYPGGILTMCGSTEAHALASKPIRYVLGDERDRWAVEAGKEGDPWKLAMARQRTFYNAKSYECSTPTIKGYSPIEKAFNEGTRERWCSRCPHCGEYHNIRWQDIRYNFDTVLIDHQETYIVKEVYYVCPGCGGISPEHEMKRAHARWIPENPEAKRNGIRSFWLNAFVSPWVSWDKIVLEYLGARKDTSKLKVVYNTLFGELWEERGGLANEDDYLARREEYEAELPDGVLVLTMGVDVQDDRLEYEVVGWGLRKENWGIKRGVILGRPDTPEVWDQLDELVARIYRYGSGKGLRVSMTFVDDGGHFTQETRQRCAQRVGKRVFDCKGFYGDGTPYTSPPKKVKIVMHGKAIGECWQYQIGVDAGKQMIMDGLKIQTPGPRYCHFPLNPEAGYEHRYFVGLLSEHLVYKEHNKNPWVWEKIPGHERNEPLDCRNYAMAAFVALAPDMDALHRRFNGDKSTDKKPQKQPAKPARKRAEQTAEKLFDW